PRSALLSISGQLFVVTQAGLTCTYQAATPRVHIPANGGTVNINVSAPNGCAWTLSSAPSWATPVEHFESGTASLSLTIAPNTTGAARSASVVIASQSVTITQQ
ncbi:MAG: BACON domain-containing protein, partial [Acidobacteriaceae bacterium]|nr:BACON domain-containing protein [Acidobacteriaceae bacterium]